MSDTIRVVVAIPTFKRPDKLRALLEVIPERILEADPGFLFSILVVDNDPDETAREVVSEGTIGGVQVRYFCEPRPGIAAARNRSLDEALDDDLLVFIDDDEFPRIGWIRGLLKVWSEYRPAAVMGRVISLFDEEVDPWVLATGVFQRRPRRSGLVIPVAAAGNLLLDLVQVRHFGVRFDSSLGLAGGEDTLFSRQLVAAGGVIRWCNESETEDLVPRERLTRTWAMKRGYSGGNIQVQVDLRMSRSRWARFRVRVGALFGGLGRIAGGSLSHVWGRLVRDLRRDARGARTLQRGFGMMAGSFGHSHEEYGRPIG